MIFPVRSDTVIIPLPYQIVILVIHSCLLWNLFLLFLCNLCDIQLITKGSCQGNFPSCLKRGISAHGMVRAVRNVCSHCRQWINQCRAFLNAKSLDCIRIIRAPDLWAVIKHTRIKTCSTTGTVLQKKIREITGQAFLHLIHTKHITVA